MPYSGDFQTVQTIRTFGFLVHHNRSSNETHYAIFALKWKDSTVDILHGYRESSRENKIDVQIKMTAKTNN